MHKMTDHQIALNVMKRGEQIRAYSFPTYTVTYWRAFGVYWEIVNEFKDDHLKIYQTDERGIRL